MKGGEDIQQGVRLPTERIKREDKWVKERTLNVAGISGDLEGRRTYKKKT